MKRCDAIVFDYMMLLAPRPFLNVRPSLFLKTGDCMLSPLVKTEKQPRPSPKFSWLGIILLWALFIGVFFWPVFQGKVLAPLDILDSLLKPWST